MINEKIKEVLHSDTFSHLPAIGYVPRWSVLLLDMLLCTIAFWCPVPEMHRRFADRKSAVLTDGTYQQTDKSAAGKINELCVHRSNRQLQYRLFSFTIYRLFCFVQYIFSIQNVLLSLFSAEIILFCFILPVLRKRRPSHDR